MAFNSTASGFGISRLSTARLRNILQDSVFYQKLPKKRLKIDVIDHWVSPRGGRYPSRWHVRVPAVGLDVEVHPALANQELGTQPRYWEGAVDLSGVREGHDATGRGYVELVGYGE